VNDDEARRARGARMFEEVVGFPAPTDPDDPLVQATLDHVFGDIWTRPGLTRKERRWIALACAASSGAPIAIDTHVAIALGSGDITIDEMREFVLQFAYYQGFPKATALRDAVERAWAAQNA
jgi:4-carboxymuconolactone decarboxylase